MNPVPQLYSKPRVGDCRCVFQITEWAFKTPCNYTLLFNKSDDNQAFQEGKEYRKCYEHVRMCTDWICLVWGLKSINSFIVYAWFLFIWLPPHWNKLGYTNKTAIEGGGECIHQEPHVGEERRMEEKRKNIREGKRRDIKKEKNSSNSSSQLSFERFAWERRRERGTAVTVMLALPLSDVISIIAPVPDYRPTGS